MPRIVILATGGTIAGRWDAACHGVVPQLTPDDLIGLTPGLTDLATFETEQIANVDSSNMTPEVWIRLAQRIRVRIADPEVAAVVVTHGTDTLEETAYFLDLTTESPKPVVLVGAQRPPTVPDTDAPRNLTDAVRVALSPEAAGKGALVVMNG